MHERYRFLTTAIIWLAFAGIVVAIVVGLTATTAEIPEAAFLAIVLFMMFLTAITGFSTARIWRGAMPMLAEHYETEQQARKVKRASQERIKRLVETLDEDEIIELETLLMAQESGTLGYDE